MCKSPFLPSGRTTSTGWKIELETDAIGLFTAPVFTVWDRLRCTFEITSLSHMYDTSQRRSTRRELSKGFVLLSSADSGMTH